MADGRPSGLRRGRPSLRARFAAGACTGAHFVAAPLAAWSPTFSWASPSSCPRPPQPVPSPPPPPAPHRAAGLPPPFNRSAPDAERGGCDMKEDGGGFPCRQMHGHDSEDCLMRQLSRSPYAISEAGGAVPALGSRSWNASRSRCTACRASAFQACLKRPWWHVVRARRVVDCIAAETGTAGEGKGVQGEQRLAPRKAVLRT